MPNRWLHEFFDILTQGRSGWKIHQEKDEPSQWMGKSHRVMRHQEFLEWQIRTLKKQGIEASIFRTPSDLIFNLTNFPGKEMSFEEATHVSHEFLDEVYSSLSYKQKKFWVETFKAIIENPELAFEKNILYPEDIELPEFKQLQKYVKSKTIEELL